METLPKITDLDQLTDEDWVLAVAACVAMADQFHALARVWDDLAFEIENPHVSRAAELVR